MDKNIILVIYFLKVINMMNGTKKMKKKIKLEKTIAERVKLRRHNADDEDLLPMLHLEGDEEVKYTKRLKVLTPTNY